MAFVWFKVSDLITPIRVSKEVEIEGLDGPEMGVLGYPDFQLHPSGMGITDDRVAVPRRRKRLRGKGPRLLWNRINREEQLHVSERRLRDGEEE